MKDREHLTDILALCIVWLLVSVLIANVAYASGYSRGFERGKGSVAVNSHVRTLSVKERIDQLPTEFGGPMYNKPHLNSNGRVGW